MSDDCVDVVVVDASVAAKWYLEEEGHERAEGLLEAGVGREASLIAPVLLAAEVANVFWQRNRRGELTADEAQDVWRAFQAAPVELCDIEPLLGPALEIALDTGCTVYDALYVALVEAEKARLVSADRKLVRLLEGSPFGGSVSGL